MDTYRFGRFEIRPVERQLLIDGESMSLGARAFDLLLALVEHRGRVVSKAELLELVWPGLVVEENNLQVQISTLRRLLGPRAIATIPGRGYRFALAPAAEDSSAPRLSDNERTNLPRPHDEFVGRQAEVAAIKALLSRHALVTLVGPGGVGKTRLAIQVGQDLRVDYRDGVWFVDLAPLAEPSLVSEKTAALLGLDPPPGGAATAIAAFLKAKRVLIILDNCEHLVAACAELANALLDSCPQVSLLASSREGLSVAGEQLFRVPPLAIPESTEGLNTSAARRYGAVQLFVERAHAAVSDFELTDETATVVTDICRRLDGMPLAIELAAPRLKVLKPQQLLEGLNDLFGLLRGGARTASPRHQTMRATLDWSYNLLSSEERALLQRVSVFAGDWSLGAATQVAVDVSLPEDAIFDLLVSLVEKSLVTVDMGGVETRYRLLASTRQYAQEKLFESEGADRMRLLATSLLTLFRRAEREWPTTPTKEWLQRYGPEVDNLRAALEWSFGPTGDSELGTTLFAATSHIWIELALQAEFRRWLAIAVANVSDTLPSDVAGRVWLFHAQTGSVGDPVYIESAMRAIECARRAKDSALLGRALMHASYLVRGSDAEVSAAYLKEAEGAIVPLGRTKLLASFLNILGGALSELGRLEECRASFTESMAIAQKLDYWQCHATAHWNLIAESFREGRVDTAIAEASKVVEECRRRRTLGVLGLMLFQLGHYLLAVNRSREALQLGIEGVQLNRSLGRSAPVNACIETIALAIALDGDFERAARLAGYVQAFYGKVRFVRGRTQQPTWERLTSILQAELTSDEAGRLAAVGASWTEEEAVREATGG